MARILNGFELKNIQKAAGLIRKGEIAAFPTETVYGLGADAFNSKAVARIFEVKKRPRFDPLIVHVSNLKQLQEVACVKNEKIYELINKFWPGPLTLILPKKKKLPYIVTAGLDTVAVRMPANIIALTLIQFADVPLAAPSANLFGKLSPTKAGHIQQQLGRKIKVILDGGKTKIGLESTILYLDKRARILRLGGLPVEEIKKMLGEVEIELEKEKPVAPGQLRTHYSPDKPLKIVRSLSEVEVNKRTGFLAFKKIDKGYIRKLKACEILSPKGSLAEAASNLFEALHRLDGKDIDVIYAEQVPETGLGLAIMDRLKKAGGF